MPIPYIAALTVVKSQHTSLEGHLNNKKIKTDILNKVSKFLACLEPSSPNSSLPLILKP